ncbi:MAG: amidohydrolase family protein [Chloroflexi bacterium]|nr:amidohydrolase family protein [Chloroflexota bacterium]
MTFVLKVGALIDGMGGEPLHQAAIVVQDGRISAIGSGDALSYPSDAEILDAPRQALMPGMIDCHIHSTVTSFNFMEDALMHPATLTAFLAARALRETLKAGFTTVRDAAGADMGLRQSLEMGLIPGPRLLVGGGIVQTGSHAQMVLPNGTTIRPARLAFPRFCDGIDTVRRGTREALREGFDFIKICASGGVLSLHDSPHNTEFTVGEIKAVVEEAAHRDKAVSAHAEGTQGIKNAIAGGVWSVEHGTIQDDEATELLVKSGVFLVPTLLITDYIAKHGKEVGIREASLRKAALMVELHAASFRRAVRAGVKIATGTDASGNLHGKNAHELALMVENGLSPMQAIVATTKTAAEVCRMSDRIGTLQVGKIADMVLVNGNPLEDIRVLEDKERLTVYQQGKKIDA